MNAHQRRRARRTLARQFPIGSFVNRWFVPSMAMKVIGYDQRHVITSDPDRSRRYSRPEHLQHANFWPLDKLP
jgi:hypothetical protein